MIRVGPRNLISDVAGVLVGNAEDEGLRSGTTVVLAEGPMTAAVDVRGGGPGTRETDALDPSCLVEAVDAVVLSGGSAYGLDAAGGVMSWLGARGRGFKVGDAVIPIVPSAILFDLLNGGDKDWGETPPYRALGTRAAESAAADFALGNAGAGLGAVAGGVKGGLGSASFVFEGSDGTELTVGALAVANPFGATVMPGTRTFWAWALERNEELGGQAPPTGPLTEPELDYGSEGSLAANTTLAVVATDAVLTKAQAGRIAIMAQDGIARAIRPVHTPFDGDTVFVVSTGARALGGPPGDPLGDIAKLGMLAADCTARAIARGVYEAEGLGAYPGYRAPGKQDSGTNP
ncbi:MAG: P1 family peptidase [Rhodospirillales bacterium]|nr:P1 family peptidase [Rhodospirillales bacterium]MDH3913344.1 P1 family peptidase [Rhodospirillales bacterium]MDH3919150.1 P1 family peptidase [Rhodospirillales bacterium]MDH3968026.1 P1 family peptidase [Rhodospirillales bacterium]